jgi:hypothetical protein
MPPKILFTSNNHLTSFAKVKSKSLKHSIVTKHEVFSSFPAIIEESIGIDRIPQQYRLNPIP